MSDIEEENNNGESIVESTIEVIDKSQVPNENNCKRNSNGNKNIIQSSTEIDNNVLNSKSITEVDSIDAYDKVKEIVEEHFKIVKEPVKIENELTESSAKDNLPFSEIEKQKLYLEFMNETEKKLKEYKLKIISQMSEVFKIFDFNRDGIIDENDLKFTFTSLGEPDVSDEKIKKMINESSEPLDFNGFVGLFELKELEFDSEMDLIKAFSKWDSNCNGFVFEENFKNDLQSWGDKFLEKEIDYALEEAPVYEENSKSMIDYIEFCSNICGLQNIRKSELFHEKYLINLKK